MAQGREEARARRAAERRRRRGEAEKRTGKTGDAVGTDVRSEEREEVDQPGEQRSSDAGERSWATAAKVAAAVGTLGAAAFAGSKAVSALRSKRAEDESDESGDRAEGESRPEEAEAPAAEREQRDAPSEDDDVATVLKRTALDVAVAAAGAAADLFRSRDEEDAGAVARGGEGRSQ